MAGRGRGYKTISVDGLREASEALTSKLPEAFRQAVASSVREGSAIIHGEARRRVRKRSRALMRSIATNIREDGLQAAVGTPMPRGRWLELGTKKMTAKPWLYPAFRRGARHIRKEMRGWGTEAGKRVRFKTKRYRAKS